MKKMLSVFKYPALFITLGALVFVASLSQPRRAQLQTERIYRFTKTKGINIPILPRAEFADRFSRDPAIPQRSDAVIQLARKLYLPEREEIREECGEVPLGRLFIALTNPDISDEARNEVDNAIDANTPSLPQTYTEGHFRFYYTDNDSNTDHNVTLSDIQATAQALNHAWDNYVQDFIEPKHYVTGGGCSPKKKMIDVKVYYLGQYLYGATSSFWDFIELNSKHVVKNSCERQTTPAHELFHRVQYSYGYVSGTSNMKWATEGTASWAQKYKAPAMGDWMDRMNEGLNIPDVDLISGRSYDACHFWVYLGQQGNGEVATIREVWSNCQANGNNMKAAVETTIKNRVPNGSSFDQFAGWWASANFFKDLSNASQNYDYQEDELTLSCGGANYGPLGQVPRTANDLNVGSNHTINGSVYPYGADYYVFSIGNTVRNIEIVCTGANQNFGYALIEIKDNLMVNYASTPGGQQKDYEFKKTVAPGDLSHVTLVVIGNPQGGNYTIVAQGSN